jgi:hypothetical protein
MELPSRPQAAQQPLHLEAEIFKKFRLERSCHGMKPLFEREWQAVLWAPIIAAQRMLDRFCELGAGGIAVPDARKGSVLSEH